MSCRLDMPVTQHCLQHKLMGLAETIIPGQAHLHAKILNKCQSLHACCSSGSAHDIFTVLLDHVSTFRHVHDSTLLCLPHLDFCLSASDKRVCYHFPDGFASSTNLHYSVANQGRPAAGMPDTQQTKAKEVFQPPRAFRALYTALPSRLDHDRTECKVGLADHCTSWHRCHNPVLSLCSSGFVYTNARYRL